MITSARYEYMEGNFAWPVPFPFGSEADVGVRLEGSDGIARKLALNKDYVLQGGNVVCVVPYGCALIVFLEGDLSRVAAANTARVLKAAAGPVYQAPQLEAAIAPQSAVCAQAAPLAAQPANDARYDELAAQVKELCEQQGKARQATLDEAGQEQLAQLHAAGEQAGCAVEQKTDVALDAIELATAEAETRLQQDTARALAGAAMADSAADKAAAASASAEDTAQKTLAELEARVRELESRLDRQALQVERQAENAAGRAASMIAQAQAQAQTELQAQARLAGQAWPQLGWLTLAQDLPARSVISLPGSMRYYPGRNSLALARNGFMLTFGKDFEEVGAGAEPSSQVRIIAPVNEGDLLSFWIYPTNVAQAAKEAQAAAEKAAHEAQAASAVGSQQLAAVNAAAGKSVTANAEHLNQIGNAGAQAQRNITASRDAALGSIREAATSTRADCMQVWQNASADLKKLSGDSQATLKDTWQKASNSVACQGSQALSDIKAKHAEAVDAVGNARAACMEKAQACQLASEQAAARAGKSCASAHDLADCAWRAAFQASIDRAQPGMGAVPSYQDLALRPSGFYVINPLLRNALPFMGVFPAEKIEDVAGYDGFFIIGGQPYPEDIRLPDIPYPEDPGSVPDMRPPADVTHWLPCDHRH